MHLMQQQQKNNCAC